MQLPLVIASVFAVFMASLIVATPVMVMNTITPPVPNAIHRRDGWGPEPDPNTDPDELNFSCKCDKRGVIDLFDSTTRCCMGKGGILHDGSCLYTEPQADFRSCCEASKKDMDCEDTPADVKEELKKVDQVSDTLDNLRSALGRTDDGSDDYYDSVSPSYANGGGYDV